MFADEHFERATAEAKRPAHFCVRPRTRMDGRSFPVVTPAGTSPAADKRCPIARIPSRCSTLAKSSPFASITHQYTTHKSHHLGRNGQSTSHSRKSQKTKDRAHARAELPGAFSFSVFGSFFASAPGLFARGPRNAPRFGVVTRHSQSSRNAPKS